MGGYSSKDSGVSNEFYDQSEIHFESTADRQRVLSWMVPRSDEPCMIMGLDDEERARMTCGHAILPESLHDYCVSELGKGKTEFRCPYRKCDLLWTLEEIRLKACLSDRENSSIEEKLSENALSKNQNVRQCPVCMSWSKRENEENTRVRCRYCKVRGEEKTDFCWNCLKTWVAEGNGFCGNPGCSSEDEALVILRNCGEKTINGVSCPSKRACPNCGTLMQHAFGCSIMKCCQCKTEFCFICLQHAVYGHKPCNLAPIQNRLITL